MNHSRNKFTGAGDARSARTRYAGKRGRVCGQIFFNSQGACPLLSALLAHPRSCTRVSLARAFYDELCGGRRTEVNLQARLPFHGDDDFCIRGFLHPLCRPNAARYEMTHADGACRSRTRRPRQRHSTMHTRMPTLVTPPRQRESLMTQLCSRSRMQDSERTTDCLISSCSSALLRAPLPSLRRYLCAPWWIKIS